MKRKFVGRAEHLQAFRLGLSSARDGHGNCLVLEGEGGVGKTALLAKFRELAIADGFAVGFGSGLTKVSPPLLPWRSALQDLGLGSAISEAPAPKLLGLLLVSGSGTQVAKVAADPNLFSDEMIGSMSTAISSFLNEAIPGASQGPEDVIVATSGNRSILTADGKSFRLIALLEGREDELIREKMRALRDEIGSKWGERIGEWDGDKSTVADITPRLETLMMLEGLRPIRPGLETQPPAASTFELVALGLSRVSRISPVLLILDDAHLMDATSMSLLLYVVSGTRAQRLLIVVASNPGDGGRELAELAQRLRTLPISRTIPLHVLPQQDSISLIEDLVSPHQIPPEFFRVIITHVGGNPLVMELTVEELKAKGVLIEESGTGIWSLTRPVAQIPLPAKMRDILDAKLSRLSGEEIPILQIASVIGTTFDPDVLALVIGKERFQTLLSLNQLGKTHGVVAPASSEWRFVHSLLRDHVYREIPDQLRERLHSRIAQEIRKKNGPSKVVLEHEVLSGKAEALLQMMNEAKTVLNGGNPDEAVRMLRIVAARAPPTRKAETLRELCVALDRGGYYADLMDASSQALALDVARGSPRDAAMDLSHQGVTLFYTGKFLAARDKFLEALALAEASRDTQLVGSLHNSIGTLLSELGRHREALRHLTYAKQALGLENPERGMVLSHIGNVFYEQGRLSRAWNHFRLAYSELRKSESPRTSAYPLVMLGTVEFARGRRDRGRTLAKQAWIRFGVSGDRRGTTLSSIRVGEMMADEGKAEIGLRYLESGLAMAKVLGDPKAIMRAQALSAIAMAETGELVNAQRYAQATLETATTLERPREVALARVGLAVVCCKNGDANGMNENMRLASKSLRSISHAMGEATALVRWAEMARALKLVDVEVASLTDARLAFDRFGLMETRIAAIDRRLSDLHAHESTGSEGQP